MATKRTPMAMPSIVPPPAKAATQANTFGAGKTAAPSAKVSKPAPAFAGKQAAPFGGKKK